MTGKIGDHNLRFGWDREKLTGKLDIRILRVAEEQILPQIRQFLDPLCLPCHSNSEYACRNFLFRSSIFPNLRYEASATRNSV